MKWVALPAAVFWLAVTPTHGKLVVSGPLARGPSCAYLTVDVKTRHTSLRKGACTSDRIRVAYDRRSEWTKVFVGPRLAFRYRDGSDTRPVSARSGDALWLYDVYTDRGPILQRWSLATGTLQQEIRFPISLWRPVIAANADGAWLMAATNGGEDNTGHVALWHATSRGLSVVRRGPRAAMWMVARDRTLWVETVAGFHSFSLWRYVGTHGRKLWTRRQAYFVDPTLGDGALWSASGQDCGKTLGVVRIDERSGATTSVETLPQLDCNQIGPGAFFDGAFWLVNGTELDRVGG
jgi:hypothetical protein